MEHGTLHAILRAHTQYGAYPPIGKIDRDLEDHDCDQHRNNFRKLPTVVFMRRDVDGHFGNRHEGQARTNRQQARDSVEHRLHTEFPTMMPQPEKQLRKWALSCHKIEVETITAFRLGRLVPSILSPHHFLTQSGKKMMRWNADDREGVVRFSDPQNTIGGERLAASVHSK